MQSAVIPTLWLVWLTYWLIAAGGTKADRRTETLASRLTHMLPLALGAALMFSRRLTDIWLYDRIFPLAEACFWLGTIMTVLGLAFSIWARVHLGRNWSGTVTLKQDHELIRTGPYGIVRHPIYTGLLFAMLGTAIALNEWRGVVALALIAAAFVRRCRLEERWLAEIFPDSYARYRAQVPALIPLPPWAACS